MNPSCSLTSWETAPEDTIRIMLATDNHIGYMERDPIRGQDSINSFREILQLAVKHNVRSRLKALSGVPTPSLRR